MTEVSSTEAKLTRKFKVIATDMDATLLDREHRLTERTLKTLRRLHDEGIHVVICTGRMTACVLPYVEQLSIPRLPLVVYNGALALAGKDPSHPRLYHTPLPAGPVSRILDFATEHGFLAQAYPCNDHTIHAWPRTEEHKRLMQRYRDLTSCTFTHADSHQHLRGAELHKLLIMSEGNIDELKERIVKALPGVEEEAHIIKADWFIEFINKKANKRAALESVCGHLGVSMEEVVSFGDGQNDIEFMQGTGLSIAVRNAHPLCKASAKRVSEWSHDEEAVAREVEALFEAGALVPSFSPSSPSSSASSAAVEEEGKVSAAGTAAASAE